MKKVTLKLTSNENQYSGELEFFLNEEGASIIFTMDEGGVQSDFHLEVEELKELIWFLQLSNQQLKES